MVPLNQAVVLGDLRPTWRRRDEPRPAALGSGSRWRDHCHFARFPLFG